MFQFTEKKKKKNGVWVKHRASHAKNLAGKKKRCGGPILYHSVRLPRQGPRLMRLRLSSMEDLDPSPHEGL